MTPMDLVNKNLYVYCDGNPLIRIDERGSLWWVAPLVGAGIGFAAQYVEDVIDNVNEGKTGLDAMKMRPGIRRYIGSMVGGAIAAIPGANVGDVIIVGGLGNVVSDYIKGDIHDEDDAQMSFVKGGAANAVGYAVEHVSALFKVNKVDKMSRPAQKQYLNKKIYHSKQGAVNTNYHAYNALTTSAKANLLKQKLVSYHIGVRASAISAFVLLPK